MKWLIIGTGWISESFIVSLRNNDETVAGVYSRTKEKGELFAKKNNIATVITSLEDLSSFDAVYIATPNSIHYDQAKQVIAQEKHLMIEKPMAHSYEKTKELYMLAEQKGIKLMEAYAHITWDEYKEIKARKVETNFMQLSSKIKNNTFASASSFSKKLFGGVIPDIGVYVISATVMILGSVKSHKIEVIERLNDVIADCKIELEHEKGTSVFRISKLKDGDNALYVDGSKVLDHISLSYKEEHRMDEEIRKFIAGIDLDLYKKISIETARVVELLMKN